jgi:hypothetical protein
MKNNNEFDLDIDINNYIEADILSITDWQEEQTFDIEVENVHCFYARERVGNIEGISHNSAMNMIVDPYDDEMINAKIGNWFNTHPHRARSNNSIILLRDLTTKERFTEIVKMNDGMSDIGFVFANSWFDMFNPCFEISKIPMLYHGDLQKIEYDEIEDFVKDHIDLLGVQGCNLTEINAEKCTTKEKFLKSCKDASILGTFQAGWTNFPYLGKVTEEIFKREALLGVSITGWMNNPKLFNPQLLNEGAELVKSTNREVAKLIGINPAARTTCVKPSGNACTAFDTKIKTNMGDMTLNEIFNVALVKDINPNELVGKTFATPYIPISVYNENNELEPITHIYVNGYSEVYEIEFEDGNTYKFTESHKLKTTNGWKRMDELTEDDEIISF